MKRCTKTIMNIKTLHTFKDYYEIHELRNEV